ncbi:hypothetical protein [Sphaerimonospora mesophila]|uniref:hypothetical protein n=1 Tax=Sphaerimonospora mesophila TaxID=37483 RepID=UPI0006E422BA
MVASTVAGLVGLILSLTIMFFVIYAAVRLALKHDRASARRELSGYQPGYGPQQPQFHAPPPDTGWQPHGGQGQSPYGP